MTQPTFLSGLKFGWREFTLLVTALALSLGLWTFIAVTDQVMKGGPHRTDNQILLALRQPDHPEKPIGPSWVRPVALDLTSLGSAAVLSLIVLLVCGFLLLQRKFAVALFVFFAAGAGALLSDTLKSLINRDRPTVVPHLAEFSKMSFPSGHSMLSAVVYLTLAVLLAQTIESRSGKIYLISAALFLSFIIGLTRLILGVHFPTDVLAGWAAGTVWALLCWLAATRLNSLGLFQRKE